MIIEHSEEVLHDALNVVSFSEAVEEHMRKGKFESYLTAIVDLANELDIEDKNIAKLISNTLRDKIQLEAEEDGYLFKTSKPMMTFE